MGIVRLSSSHFGVKSSIRVATNAVIRRTCVGKGKKDSIRREATKNTELPSRLFSKIFVLPHFKPAREQRGSAMAAMKREETATDF